MTIASFGQARRLSRSSGSGLVLRVFVLGLLVVLVALPLLRILAETLFGEASVAWTDALASPLARNLFWLPLGNTMLIGASVAAGCVLIGGFLAWLVVMTDVPFRRTIGFMATLPFMIPSFATALAWGSVFRNDRVGGQVGFLEGLGLAIPDALAWGMVPTIVVLTAHYYALAYLTIAAALATVSGDLVEAAQMTGASRRRIVFGIVLPVALPAVIAGGSLAFAGAVSNFAAPALLGLPVRMQTLATRMFGMIEIGQTARGYVLATLLILVSAVFLIIGNRLLSRRSFATITGKGSRARRFALGPTRIPLTALALVVGFVTTILPILILMATSLAPSASALLSNWTLHFWIGPANTGISQGLPGVLHNPQILTALGVTITLGICVALAVSAIGLLIALVLTKYPAGALSAATSQLSFVPMLVPGIAFGAAYIALFGAPIGPFPALYGTFALLVIACTAYQLPFATQTGRAVVSQIAGDLDESARLTGASFLRRLTAITAPLSIRGILAGGLISFVNVISDLALVVLLFTPTLPVLSVLSYRYASDGFAQFANAVTLIILALSILASLLANQLSRRAQPWLTS
jgi:iron(III) transport system permease protein